MELENKRIIVTGAAQGIGEATLRAFVREGAKVVGFDLNEEGGTRVAKEASESGPGSASFRTVDVSDKAVVDAATDSAVEELGGLDVLINVAGFQRSAPAADITDEHFEAIFHVNVLGTVHTNQAAYRHMKPNHAGAIVNFGSMSGLTAELTNATYGMSKAAVHTWTRSVAREWGPDGIRMNAVLPYMNTPMFDKFRGSLTPDELAAYDAEIAKSIPLGGKFGNADLDLAPVLVFLASDASHFITGQLLPVDGGLTSVR
ncbi:SDR family NAD(P)-dependent oxidoreductase [Frondihabitans cladoniiphilus]|uniref:SDR family oxidoreductase n=1 Tax=Frondihabitans cladoniiphilus TaxID=715785 RepID=A0ABP8VR91_9MICO